jgi:hypothetical protein
MNKRIEELALQCGAWHLVYDQKRFMVDRKFDVEQFAELLVFECIKIAVFKGDATTGKAIKEHFGVE